MLFQHLLLTSLNLHHTEVHVQHHEYIIYKAYHIYIISSFLIRHDAYLASKKLILRYTVNEERPV